MGSLINTISIIAGGLIGMVVGRAFSEDQQEALTKACGISVLFIAIAGAMEGMLRVEGGQIASGKSMLVVLCLAVGTLIGELIGIEKGFVTFGEWLKIRTGNSGDAQFVNAFVTASLTVCVGAMAVVGSLQDGIYADHAVLYAKAVLDFVIIVIMTSSMGKGAAFSAVSVGVFQGVITLLSSLIAPVLTEQALSNISYVGNIMIFCVGLNLVFGKKVRVASLLPSLVFAVMWAAFLKT